MRQYGDEIETIPSITFLSIILPKSLDYIILKRSVTSQKNMMFLLFWKSEFSQSFPLGWEPGAALGDAVGVVHILLFQLKNTSTALQFILRILSITI